MNVVNRDADAPLAHLLKQLEEGYYQKKPVGQMNLFYYYKLEVFGLKH